MPLLHYRAGRRALERIREHGLRADQTRALVLPATGPKWLISTGFDRALIDAGWLTQRAQPLLMLGASAGTWRALALASAQPRRAHDALIAGYCEQRFTFKDDARSISTAFRDMLARVFTPADRTHALQHRDLSLAITCVCLREVKRMRMRVPLAAALASSAALNPLYAGAVDLFFERTVFSTPDARARTPLAANLQGRHEALSADNLIEVALASGSVPFYMHPVSGIAADSAARFLDGGLTDYHLRQPLDCPDGNALVFLHQARILPNWFDKMLGWRALGAQAAQDVVLIYPDAELVRSLPGGRLPDRDDFRTSVRDPDARVARWKQCAEQSQVLGDTLLEDIRSGAIAGQVLPL